MKVAFKISPTVEDFSSLHLLLEVGNHEMSFLLYSLNPFAIQGLYVFECNNQFIGKKDVDSIKVDLDQHQLLERPFASVNILYNYKESFLVPIQYFVDEEKANICELFFGIDKTAYCFQENSSNHETKVVYRVPQMMYDFLNEVYPKNKFSHTTSFQISNSKSNNLMECFVYHHYLKLVLFKENKLQIVQYVAYETPLDASYHLLNICEKFKILPSEVMVSLNGMIEENSNLYKELYKYFLHIGFASLPSDVLVAEPMQKHPIHFYTNLSALAQCVS